MTIQEVIIYGAQYGTTLTEEQVKAFFAEHQGTPSAMQLAIFVGAMDEKGNFLPKKQA
ncbi:hypothetical protein DIEEDFHO_00007 [Enterococcus phage vB_OCPT_Bill]|uniref:Uncharacterized protein n=1 Tax=Enterococcus phage vB_OCPT_Bill TaxID=2922322 RepID=A0AAE9K971_9CAUD|nr:hypothetical protein [Enterococcus phage UTI-EfS3]UNZ10673.1 hypothetical protein DIEEDFHO_00007 [Enterococcus phage vB_OCPT_Bill]